MSIASLSDKFWVRLGVSVVVGGGILIATVELVRFAGHTQTVEPSQGWSRPLSPNADTSQAHIPASQEPSASVNSEEPVSKNENAASKKRRQRIDHTEDILLGRKKGPTPK